MALHDASFKTVDQEEWPRAYKLGVVSTPKQERIPIEEQTNEIKASFQEFCSEDYAELISELFHE